MLLVSAATVGVSVPDSQNAAVAANVRLGQADLRRPFDPRSLSDQQTASVALPWWARSSLPLPWIGFLGLAIPVR